MSSELIHPFESKMIFLTHHRPQVGCHGKILTWGNYEIKERPANNISKGGVKFATEMRNAIFYVFQISTMFRKINTPCSFYLVQMELGVLVHIYRVMQFFSLLISLTP